MKGNDGPQVPRGEWRKLAHAIAGGRTEAPRAVDTVRLDVGPGGGRAVGLGAYHSMTASWNGLSGEAVFSANASPAFVEEVTEKAGKAGYLLSPEKAKALLEAHVARYAEPAETRDAEAKLLAKLNGKTEDDDD